MVAPLEEPVFVINEYSPPRIFLACTTCGGYAWLAPPEGKTTGTMIANCYRGGEFLMVRVAEVPESLTPESLTCSPDGSAVAYWVPTDGTAWTVKPGSVKKSSPVPTLDAKMDELRKLKEYSAHHRKEFENDPVLLDAFDRLVDREKRKIMDSHRDE